MGLGIGMIRSSLFPVYLSVKFKQKLQSDFNIVEESFLIIKRDSLFPSKTTDRNGHLMGHELQARHSWWLVFLSPIPQTH